MSTLGRKAMKKTLKHLKEDALKATKNCLDDFETQLKKYDNMSETDQELVYSLRIVAGHAIVRLLRYIQALEDYGYELDEKWDKLLKTIGQARAGKPKSLKKEKKPSYRV